MNRLRSVGWKPLAALSVLLSAAVVLTALPSRRAPSRTATSAFVPLRQPTGPEAVALIRAGAGGEHPRSAIIGEEAGHLLLASRLYAVPAQTADGSHAEWHDDGRSEYRISAATWERYYALYRVPRVEYERALGRPLQGSDFTRPAFVDEYAVSFDPANVPRYVAVEIAFLAAWFFLLARTLLAIRRPTAVLPALVPLLLAPMPFVIVYSPAFFDADWFHQRVVVEDVALLSLGVGGILLVPALASAVLYAAFWIAERLAERLGSSASAYRKRAIVGIAALCLLAVAVQYVRYRAEVAACLEDRRIVRARVAEGGWTSALLGAASSGLPRAKDLMDDPGVSREARAAIEAVLAPAGDRADRGVVVLSPATGKRGEHLFLWRNGFLYADFRHLEARFESLIDAKELAEIQRTGDHSTGFGRWLGGGHHLCGETLDVDGHSVLIAVEQPFSRGIRIFR